ncbi:MAG: O-antigen ligase family protein [Bacteroidetes bacterium]|nr:O-antigen ligase family protein [Bacteroidota bacterium]
MKKQQTKVIPPVKQQKVSLKPQYIFLLMAYIFVSVFTPNFYTLDSNAPKFLAVAILNLISLLIFFSDAEYKKRPELQWGFFKGQIGIAYSIFILISLLSFSNAINLSESIMNIVKILTVFTSAYVFYVIIENNRGYLHYIIIAFTILLLIDSITVFYGISKYIAGKIPSIYEIKSIYSNKNILASALFVKLPIAVFLLYYSNGWRKKLAYLAVFFALLSILFMSTRAFYLGLFIVLITLLIFAILRGIKIKEKKTFSSIIFFSGLLLGAVLIFNITQHYLYPSNSNIYNKDLVSRLSTISTDVSSGNLRFISWQQSLQLIKEHPVIGVGTGNWKINILKYENKTSQNYISSYKNHNDFIEITAETGIIGGLSYLSIFFFIIYGFAKSMRKTSTDENKIQFLFLSVLGIIAYSIDAFFNFPADRPEIQMLFAFYLAIAVSINPKQEFNISVLKNLNKYFKPRWFAYFFIIILCITTYLLILNVKSSRYQRYYLEDKTNDLYTKSSSLMIAGFPSIPNISCLNEPIVSNIAYYLVHEGKNQEAIDLLMKDNSSPFDGRKEFYISVAYSQMGKQDSAIVWGRKARLLKPMEYNINRNLSIMAINAGLKDEAMKITDEYAKQIKISSQAWLLASNSHWQCGDKLIAVSILDSAVKYLPDDSAIIAQRQQMKRFIKFIPYESLYNQAISALNTQKYTEALSLFTDFINKKPDIAEAYQQRAVCYYTMHNYTQSLSDIEKAIKIGGEFSAQFLNLRGLNKLEQGKKDDACSDFKAAMEKGDPDGKNNYIRFCDKTGTVIKN